MVAGDAEEPSDKLCGGFISRGVSPYFDEDLVSDLIGSRAAGVEHARGESCDAVMMFADERFEGGIVSVRKGAHERDVLLIGFSSFQRFFHEGGSARFA